MSILLDAGICREAKALRESKADLVGDQLWGSHRKLDVQCISDCEDRLELASRILGSSWSEPCSSSENFGCKCAFGTNGAV